MSYLSFQKSKNVSFAAQNREMAELFARVTPKEKCSILSSTTRRQNASQDCSYCAYMKLGEICIMCNGIDYECNLPCARHNNNLPPHIGFTVK